MSAERIAMLRSYLGKNGGRTVEVGDRDVAGVPTPAVVAVVRLRAE